MRRIAIPAALFAFCCITFPVSARVPAQLGRVNFPTSCAPRAQPTLEKGLALLHSFQYLESEQTFTEAAKQDPQCAMAHWGKAMALYHQLWDFPEASTLKKGLDEIEQAQKSNFLTDRERAYLAAAAAFYQDNPKLSHAERTQAYSSALAKLHEQFPDDDEAAAFYALSLVALADVEHIDDLANRKKAIAILEPLFHRDPDNPGSAHYLIHATDFPELAPLGLDAARRYARIAPDSSHALHMPSHIFSRLGLWQESIASNIAAAASAAHATEMHTADAHYQFHAMDFLAYAYLQSGQETNARQVAADGKNVPGANAEEAANRQASLDIAIALELHRWKEAAALPIPAVRAAWQDSTYWARAIGAARSGDVTAAKLSVKKLQETVKAREAHSKESGYEVSGEKATDLREAEAWLAFAEGKADAAVKELRAAADRQDAKGVDTIGIPAREMLADMLLELKHPSEALAEYKIALKESPNRFDSLYGAARSAQAAGDAIAAQSFYAKLAEISGPGADRPELAAAKTYLAQK